MRVRLLHSLSSICSADKDKNSRMISFTNAKFYKHFKSSFSLWVKVTSQKKLLFIYFNGSPLKVMKKTFYLMLKARFVLEIFTFLFLLFGYVEKRLDKKAMVNFKIYDVADWSRELSTWKKEHFSSLLNGFQLSEIKTESGSLTWNKMNWYLRTIFYFMFFHNGKVLNSCCFKFIVS